MGYSRHELSQPRSQGSLLPVPTCWRENLGTRLELSTIRMLYSLKKIVILHPYLPITAASPQRPLSSPPKVAVVEGLYFHSCNFHHRVNHVLTMACSPVGLISSMDWALRRSGFDSRPDFFFFRFFFNRLDCSFNCEDHVHFHICIRSSKYDSFHMFSIHLASLPIGPFF